MGRSPHPLSGRVVQQRDILSFPEIPCGVDVEVRVGRPATGPLSFSSSISIIGDAKGASFLGLW